jgi:hypothetical protein
VRTTEGSRGGKSSVRWEVGGGEVGVGNVVRVPDVASVAGVGLNVREPRAFGGWFFDWA